MRALNQEYSVLGVSLLISGILEKTGGYEDR